jgi:type I restriction enzyme S subunit
VPGVLKRFREAVLEVAVSGRLTEEWRNERQIRSTSPLEWRQIRFGEIVESSLYGPRFSAQDYVVDGVPTLRTSDMDSQGRLTLRNPPRVRISEEEIERLGLKDGDLVLTRTGATIGKCAVYDSSLGPALPSAYLIRFRLLQNLAVPRYVLLFLLSPIGQRLLLAGSTAVAQPNVNAQTVRRFSFSLPSHLEQIEIIRRVEELLSLADLLERKYQAAISKVEKLAPAVLAKAFRGELVPQDPNDEPASVLFERIRAEVAGPARESKHRGRARRKAVARQGSGGIGARSANRRKGRR